MSNTLGVKIKQRLQ